MSTRSADVETTSHGAIPALDRFAQFTWRGSPTTNLQGSTR
ncbi:hypothetical protein B005_3746 [Nocardiopsis alba ATCC BAA-2165]|uniref:Uncharacterized protein n=1 Tax=Nocardiopsis alba (strain ATCC BAA-2165 / BE74) TaxID=1205910 RepID=J7LI61_NOCAA|nr:hypothetical protein B005_3746 [Nocardiopsis alba ATCC BAA-2165]